MAKRPVLTEDSFLQHLFSPAKHALPSGLRKRALAFSKGRTKARVASYNRMSAANQELLKRSGLREDYLRGTGSLKDARSALRSKAVDKGFAKPLRPKKSANVSRGTSPLDTIVALHVIKELRDSGRDVNANRIHKNVPYMSEEDKRQAARWKVGHIKAYGADRSKVLTIEDTQMNPLWYH